MSSRYRPPQLIKDAAKHGELVVFVGAGASILCGSPNWQGFANQVVDALEQADALTFLEAEQLRGIADSRRTLSIAMALARDSGVSLDFDAILHPGTPPLLGLELYDLLSGLRPVFVTTNYDKWLDRASPPVDVTSDAPGPQKPAASLQDRAKYYLKEHLSSDRLSERGAVIHLHGSFSAPSSMIVSLKDYIEHYADTCVRHFLTEMFRNSCVLFVGYGLAELEVLDHIMRVNKVKPSTGQPRHFLLYAHRSSELPQTQFIERFFMDQCGVQVIPYCIDAKGYGELVEVIKAWASELDVRDSTLLDEQARLDRCIASPGDSERVSAMRMLRKKPDLTAYFMNSVKDPVWFGDLESEGMFEAT